MTNRRAMLGGGLAAAFAGVAPGLLRGASAQPAAPGTASRPNIIMIMADDVGYWNVGAYSHGMMVPTPNLDRLAREGMLFTDHYAEPTCTPGRAAFITGQMPIRTGLTTVGVPGSPIGIDQRDPTLATVLRAQGYRTAQIGKNHLGDLNRHLPTVHGFDSFFGNLYHLNTEDEPEDPDWPTDPGFNARYRPRGVLDCVAMTADNPAPVTDARFGPGARSAARIRGHSHANAWKRWMMNSSTVRCVLLKTAPAPASPSSCGTTRRACISTLISGQKADYWRSRIHRAMIFMALA